MTDAERLAIQRQTNHLFTPEGRMLHTNSPDRSAAPRFCFSGCRTGNLSAIGWQLPESVANRLLALTAEEPPFVAENGGPVNLDQYLALVAPDGPPPVARLGVTYVLLRRSRFDAQVRLVHSHTQTGKDLLARLAEFGLPPRLLDLNFRDDISELWPPWCVGLVDGEIASIAFAARLSASGAEVGVATIRSMRGRGYGAAVTAGWTRSPLLKRRALFYSAAQANRSSRAVAARLGLRQLGATLEIG